MKVTNIKYTVDGMRFDAAVDWDWELHLYEESAEQREKVLPIELYNLNDDWDIKMIYQDGRVGGVDFDFIIKETKEWIKQNTTKQC